MHLCNPGTKPQLLSAAFLWPDSERFSCPAPCLLPLPGGHDLAQLFAGWVSPAIRKSTFSRHSRGAGKGFSVYLGNPTKLHGWYHQHLGYNSFCKATAEPPQDFYPKITKYCLQNVRWGQRTWCEGWLKVSESVKKKRAWGTIQDQHWHTYLIINKQRSIIQEV